jgi:AcrR family transcriptional regulator
VPNENGPEQRGGLGRSGLISASLEVVQRDGLAALTMRALAERLGVKAASLYWHVRDREQLLELVAGALLDEVPAAGDGADWRTAARSACDGLDGVLAAHRDAARLLLDVPDVVERSALAGRLRLTLERAGLPAGDAAEAAEALLFLVIAAAARSSRPGAMTAEGQAATLVIENPSRGVTVRAGSSVEGLARASRSGVAAAGVVATGSEVVVRRPRGTRQADVDLSPLHPWSVHVKGGTWNTRLLLTGLDVREIKLDGGATRVECVLPPPRGVVPILLSGGAVKVDLHRPPGTAASAKVSAGALQVRLDGSSTRVALLDSHWTSGSGVGAPNRYDLSISAGAVQVTLDEHAAADAGTAAASPMGGRELRDASLARELLLSGIEHRLAERRAPGV